MIHDQRHVTIDGQRGESMWEFFHSWRRKAGCVALVMALVLLVGWIRSFSITEIIVITPIAAVSKRSGLEIGYTGWKHPFWGIGPIEFGNGDEDSPFRLWGRRSTSTGPGYIVQYSPLASVSYSHYVMPLTLLSAYLLLWPGKRSERKVKCPLSDISAEPQR